MKNSSKLFAKPGFSCTNSMYGDLKDEKVSDTFKKIELIQRFVRLMLKG